MSNPPPRRQQDAWSPPQETPTAHPFQTTRLAYISKETKNGTPTVKWQYRETIESSSVESRQSLDLLCHIADTLEVKGLGLQLLHWRRRVGVLARDITSKSNLYACCASITGLSSKLTTLLLSVTSDNNALLNHQSPLKDLSLRFSDKWSLYPDTFLGKQAGLIGIFSRVHLESITWESTAKTVSEITTTTSNNETNQVGI